MPTPAVIAVVISFLSLPSLAADGKGILNLNLENDLFGSGNDRHYTHGTELSYVSDTYQPSWLLSSASFLPFIQNRSETRFSVKLGQKMFTPDDISRKDLIMDDRPYAGWLYTSLGFLSDNRGQHRYIDKLELVLGLVGPDSGAESVQREIHELTDSEIPMGWNNQLDDEVTLDLLYQRQWMIPIVSDNADIIPVVGFQLGTAMRYVSTGVTVRLGSGLGSDYGPPMIRPTSVGSGYFQPDQSFYWYLFAGISGRYVDHNLFLEGNRDGNNHGVHALEWVADLQAGAVMGFGNWRFTLTNIFRTREFENQREPDEFGSIAISYRF